MTARLYRGEVAHARHRPVRNAFRYPVFFLRFRIDRMDDLAVAGLSVDRFNLTSVHRRDHGPRDGSDLERWVRDLLRREGCDHADGSVWLQTFPRVLGYVFNPVSFWLCHDRQERLRAVLCEVSNTFGERHNYLLTHPDGRPIESGDWLEARKAFHVSPFFPVDGGYRFRFSDDGTRAHFRIDYGDDGGTLLATSIAGEGRALTGTGLARCILAQPFMTAVVMARIHWQALRLWLKGAPFFRKPALPAQETTR